MSAERKLGLVAGMAMAYAAFFWTGAMYNDTDFGVFVVQSISGCVMALLALFVATLEPEAKP